VRFRAVQAWRKARRLPRLIALADADHTLPIDLDNVLSVETFIHLSRSREEVSLVELFPAPDQLCAHGPEGRFVNELIVPFVRKPNADEKRPVAKSPRSSLAVPRTFPPGSEWLYAKLYTGSATADQVLREVVSPLTAKVLRCGAADQWFFIRYGDPHWHVRLRFHGEPARLHAEVLPAVEAAAAPLLAEGRLWRVQFDTYEREVERYGGAEGVLLAEQIFQADSEAVLEILGLLEAGDAGLNERWQLTLRGIDMLLNDFAFDLEARLALMRNVREQFAREHRADADLKAKIGEKFRKERQNLERLLDAGEDAESELSPGFEILRRRSARLAPMMAELRACDAAGRLTMPLDDIALSCIHMHANRLLRSAQRAQETALYNFLARLHDSQVARTDAFNPTNSYEKNRENQRRSQGNKAPA
jgi:thiopeptide-type bacteriocin biosynthesis protein